MNIEYINDVIEFFRLKIFPVLWLIFTIFFTHLWLGDFVQYKLHPSQFTIIQDNRITRTYANGRIGPGGIDITYQYGDEWLNGNCTRYWGDRINKKINIAIDDKGDLIRVDFPLNISLFFEVIFVLVAVFEIWISYIMIKNELRT